jgi:hypothetical protein
MRPGGGTRGTGFGKPGATFKLGHYRSPDCGGNIKQDKMPAGHCGYSMIGRPSAACPLHCPAGDRSQETGVRSRDSGLGVMAEGDCGIENTACKL